MKSSSTFQSDRGCFKWFTCAVRTVRTRHVILLFFGCVVFILIVVVQNSGVLSGVPTLTRYTLCKQYNSEIQAYINNFSLEDGVFQTHASQRGNTTDTYKSKSGIKDSLPANKMQERCPGVLTAMMKGHWVPRDLTDEEHVTIGHFLSVVRKEDNIPSNFSRNDGKCGNVTFLSNRNARALCDPDGPTPCCDDGVCKNVSMVNCTCSKCYDLRKRIHAEYATWRPADKRCKPKSFMMKESCKLLSGSNIYIIGDSILRHFYTALLMLLRGNYRYGALVENISQVLFSESYKNCTGMYAFGPKICRSFLDMHPGILCNRNVGLYFSSHSHYYHAGGLTRVVKQRLNKAKTVILAGIGLHDNGNFTEVSSYIMPSVRALKQNKAKWPLLLWSTAHAPGILKSPRFVYQNYKHITVFNNKMKAFLKNQKIPVFDTFNMTATLVSFDGSHYGLGANLAKVQMFLNYIQELKDKGEW